MYIADDLGILVDKVLPFIYGKGSAPLPHVYVKDVKNSLFTNTLEINPRTNIIAY